MVSKISEFKDLKPLAWQLIVLGVKDLLNKNNEQFCGVIVQQMCKELLIYYKSKATEQ